MTNDKKYVVRMTTKDNPDGYWLAAYNDMGDMLNAVHEAEIRLNNYRKSHIVDARSTYRYADKTSRIIYTIE